MKLIGSSLLFALAIQSFCCADVTKLSKEDRRVLQDSSRFHEVHTTSDLPSAILALCDGGGDGKLADPDQKWNAIDAITDSTLPGKRLIWAAVGGEHCGAGRWMTVWIMRIERRCCGVNSTAVFYWFGQFCKFKFSYAT